jgi:hypothetical protein
VSAEGMAANELKAQQVRDLCGAEIWVRRRPPRARGGLYFGYSLDDVAPPTAWFDAIDQAVTAARNETGGSP